MASPLVRARFLPTDLTSDAGLLEYLAQTPYACSSMTRLSGGFSNFTYRGQLILSTTGSEKTVVIKHTEPYVAANRAFVLDDIRSYFEQVALGGLARLPPVQHDGVLVTTPTLHHFYRDTSTQIIQDFHDSTDLKTYLLKYPVSASQARSLGAGLGSWAKSFHTWGSAPEQTDLRATMQKNSTALGLKFMVNFGPLVPTVDMFPAILGECRGMLEQIEAEMKKRSASQDVAQLGIIHGDFWSGNILLRDAPLADAAFTPSDPVELLIIDWELSHLATPSQDLGQCFAELYLPSHFRGVDAGGCMIEAFLKAYGKLADEEAYEVALRFGVHLIVWPCRRAADDQWGTKEQLERCVECGRDFVRNAWEKDKEWFRGGVLDKLFFS